MKSLPLFSRAEFVKAFSAGVVGTAMFPREAFAQVPVVDSYRLTGSPNPMSFSGLGLGNGSGLAFSSDFEVPGWAKWLSLGFVQRGTSDGTTKLHASSDSHLMFVLDALGKVAGFEEKRIVVLSFRRDPNDPNKVWFVSKMVKQIDDVVVASVAATPANQQLDVLRSQLGAGEKIKGAKTDLEEPLWLEEATPHRITLRTDEPKKGKPRGDQVVLEKTATGHLRIAFKSNVLQVKLP